MSTSCTLKQARFPMGRPLELQSGCVHMPVSGHGGWYCAGTAVCHVKSVRSFPAPLNLPLTLLQGRVLSPWVGPAVKSTCIGNMHISEECSRQLGVGCFTLFSFLSTSCWCVFSVTVCTKSSALLSAAINAASTDKSNKYFCALWVVLVYFLVLVFLS